MPRNVDGTFSLARDWETDEGASTPFSAELHQEQDADIAAALSDTPTKAAVAADIASAVATATSALQSYADAAGAVDLGVSTTTTQVVITNTNGDNATIAAASGSAAGVMTAADKAKLDAIPSGGVDAVDSDAVTNASTVAGATVSEVMESLQAQITAIDEIPLSQKGTAGGVATLDETGKLTSSQVPDGFEDVVEAANLAGFPATGETGRIYIAKDTNLTYRWDGGAYVQLSAAASAGGAVALADLDERVAGLAKTNGFGGSLARCHWTTRGNALVLFGDVGGLGLDPAGDNFRFVIPWNTATNGNITEVYAGANYFLIMSDQATGNVYHIGGTDHGQGGMGATSGVTLTPTRITTFVTDAVKIAKIVTEASPIATPQKFWFAITTTGAVYSCGFSGTNHMMGYNNTANLSTPRKMTYSDGTTPLANVADIYCSGAHSPVFARLSTGAVLRWGAGTSGAHGNNSTSAMTWPDALETSPGSGTDRTDIAGAAVSGGNTTATNAAAWIWTTGGKVECAGAQDYGIGDGAALGATDAVTFQPAAGAIDAKTVTKVVAGGGSRPMAFAITADGLLYFCGRNAGGIQGNGTTVDRNTFVRIDTDLPAGFSGAITDVRVAGAWDGSAENVTVYVEAVVSGVTRICAIGADSVYQTARGTTGVAAASRTYLELIGGHAAITDWQPVGTISLFGIEVLDEDGQTWYAGDNSQGQAGVLQETLHAVPYLQPAYQGARVAKSWGAVTEYSTGTTYSYLDIARYLGSSWQYINASPSAGNLPPTLPTTENAYWRLVAERGDITTIGLHASIGPWARVQMTTAGETLALEGGPPSLITLDPSVTGSSPNRDILSGSGDGLQMTAYAGDNFAPQVHPDHVSYVTDFTTLSGSWTGVLPTILKRRNIQHNNFRWPFRPQTRSILLYIDAGQSYKAGNSAFNTVATQGVIHSSAVLPGRAAMFAGENGTSPRMIGEQDISQRSYLAELEHELHGLVDLREGPHGGQGETQASQRALYLEGDLDEDEAIVMINAAIGGATIGDLTAGRAPFVNIARAVARLKYMCRIKGCTLEIGGFLWQQGRADSSGGAANYASTYSSYTTALGTLYAAVQDLGLKLLGQANVPFIINQNCATTAELAVADAQLDFVIANANAYLSVPEYIANNPGNEGGPTDTGHPGARSQALMGLHTGYTITQLRNSINPKPLAIYTATRSGTTVTCTLNDGTFPADITLPIQIRSSPANNPLVTDPTSSAAADTDNLYGIRYRVGDMASASYATKVNAATINGSNQLVLTLSGTPAGDGSNEWIEVGHVGGSTLSPSTSPRTVICDSATEDTVIDGVTYRRYRHMAIQSKQVTVS